MLNVLVIEADDALRAVLTEMVEAVGGTSVGSVADVAEGINVLRRGGIDVLIVDVLLLIRQSSGETNPLRDLDPNVKVVVLAGDVAPEPETAERARKLLHGKIVLSKPVLLEALRAALRQPEGDH